MGVPEGECPQGGWRAWEGDNCLPKVTFPRSFVLALNVTSCGPPAIPLAGNCHRHLGWGRGGPHPPNRVRSLCWDKATSHHLGDLGTFSGCESSN